MITKDELKRMVLQSGMRYSIPDVTYRLLDGEIIAIPDQLQTLVDAIEKRVRDEQREEDVTICLSRVYDQCIGSSGMVASATAKSLAEAIRATSPESEG